MPDPRETGSQPRGGPNGITESAIEQGVALMARLDPAHTVEDHEKYVRALINGVREHLVQRHLYEAVCSQMREGNAGWGMADG